MIEKIKENINIIIITTLGLTLIILTIINVIPNKKQNTQEIIEQEPLQTEQIIEEIEVEQTIKKIKVDIKGEVNKPGVYELNEGDRVIEAINKSGGLTKKADTSLINLSKNLKDEMVIVIYNKDTINDLKTQETKTETIIEYIEKECVCNDPINDACIENDEKKEDLNEETNEKIESNKENKKISLNQATIEELKTLTGIGEEKAKAIIEYRKTNGNFKTIEEIMNIKGIGESTFEKFKHQITI